MSNGAEEAAVAVQRALLACVEPAAAEQLAAAQLRLAWQETVDAAGLTRGTSPAGWSTSRTAWRGSRPPSRSWPRS